jgi:hypothetical protein
MERLKWVASASNLLAYAEPLQRSRTTGPGVFDSVPTLTVTKSSATLIRRSVPISYRVRVNIGFPVTCTAEAHLGRAYGRFQD